MPGPERPRSAAAGARRQTCRKEGHSASVQVLGCVTASGSVHAVICLPLFGGLPRLAMELGGWSAVQAWCALAGAAFAVGATRGLAAGALAARVPAHLRVAALALILGIEECAWSHAAPWFEAISLHRLLSHLLPGQFLHVLGLEGSVCVVAAAVGALFLRSSLPLAIVLLATLLLGIPDGSGERRFLAVAVAVPPVRPEDAELRWEGFLDTARATEAALVVAPEDSYPWRERLDRDARPSHVEPIPADLLFGLTWLGDPLRGREGNRALLQRPDGTLAYRDKAVLAPMAEPLRVRPARSCGVALEGASVTMAVAICYELLARECLSGTPAELIASPSSGAFDRRGATTAVMRDAARLRAIEFGVPVVRAADGDGAVVVDRDGRVVEFGATSAAPLTATVTVGPTAPLHRHQRGFAVPFILLALSPFLRGVHARA